jgi:hypothetical protein
MEPARVPLLSSWINWYEIIVKRTLARLPNAHQSSCTQGLFLGGKNAWCNMAVDGTICDSVYGPSAYEICLDNSTYHP